MNNLVMTNDLNVIKMIDNIKNSIDNPSDDNAEPSMVSFFTTLTTIWQKILLLTKKLRDVMQSYDQQKQEQSFKLGVCVLHEKELAIDTTYQARLSDGICSMVGASFAIAGIGAESAGYSNFGSQIGMTTSSLFDGVGKNTAAAGTREAEQEQAIATLQDQGSHSYDKTLDDILLKARELMQQVMDFGRKVLELTGQAINAMSR